MLYMIHQNDFVDQIYSEFTSHFPEAQLEISFTVI